MCTWVLRGHCGVQIEAECDVCGACARHHPGRQPPCRSRPKVALQNTCRTGRFVLVLVCVCVCVCVCVSLSLSSFSLSLSHRPYRPSLHSRTHTHTHTDPNCSSFPASLTLLHTALGVFAAVQAVVDFVLDKVFAGDQDLAEAFAQHFTDPLLSTPSTPCAPLPPLWQWVLQRGLVCVPLHQCWCTVSQASSSTQLPQLTQLSCSPWLPSPLPSLVFFCLFCLCLCFVFVFSFFVLHFICAEALTSQLLAKAVPLHAGNDELHDKVQTAVAELESFLGQAGLLTSSNAHTLSLYVSNVTQHDHNRRRQEILARARAIMMADNFNTVQVEHATERGGLFPSTDEGWELAIRFIPL